MMDKKSANGFQSKAGEGGVQRKQLPYSVETPYGFHLDLDFLKYVDDIEKGNTIKRVHIQRRVKGPPKFSTLPRNFSLPGHGVRPPPKEKDSTWSGTSTLGPKPKSRVTEVQQIFDFRANEGVTSSLSSRVTTSQGTSYVSTKPKDEVGAGARGVEDKTGGIQIQSRPNLLRASSMPITLQQRKSSDSSSPDRTVGTPENGSTENMFRASPDVTERRCVPQDRAGLHQQITVALKRVRELEEQVKTIPELKAQICSLREEREQLLLQLQAQAKAQASKLSTTVPTGYDPRTNNQSQGQRPSQEMKLVLKTQPIGRLEDTSLGPSKQATGKEKQGETEKTNVLLSEVESSAQGERSMSSAQEVERQSLQLDIPDKLKETESPLGQTVQKLPRDISGEELLSITVALKETETAAKEGKPKDPDDMQKLQEKLTILEAKLIKASQELERTNSLLKQQVEENKLKEERILQLSEGTRVEVCTAHERPRRESIDTGTVTERIDFTHQETETESPGTVDQGTDTDKICIEVCIPKQQTKSTDQGPVTGKADTHDQETEMEAAIAAASPPRPRANSMERGTLTESIITLDQMTETPVAERVNQVTETEGEMVTDHPQRPRASSVDRGTETERVGTVDRVTETEVAQRADQQTETEMERRHDNNPARSVEAESQVSENAGSQRDEVVLSERTEDRETYERIQRESERLVAEVLSESSAAAVESIKTLDVVRKNEECASSAAKAGENKIKVSSEQDDSETKEITEVVETRPAAPETTEKKETGAGEVMSAAVKETVATDTVAVTDGNSAVKTAAPVRPQRGRKPSVEQAQPSPPQLQVVPVRPRRGSSETQSQPQTKTQPQVQEQSAAQLEARSPEQLSETQVKHQTPSVPQVEDHTIAKKPPGESGEKQSESRLQTQTVSPGSSEVQVRPKSIQALSQTSAPRRDSKELKAPQRVSGASHTPRRGSGEAQIQPPRQASSDAQTQPQGSRRSSSEAQAPQKDASETQSLRRGSSEAAQRRGSSEAQGSRRDPGEAQPPRRGSSESPTSPAALGQVVTRITGLLGEQWAHLGSSSGAQQTASQQESTSTQKKTTGKRAEAGKATSAKPAGKAAPAAAATGKPAGKPGTSKMSSIQSQLVSSLSVLSAFYSPSQKAAAASKQQEQGLKSIMKKNGAAGKQGNKGAKKNLKFVGVNGGYETTSSEESSGDEKSNVEVEEEDSSEPEVEKEPEKEPEKQPEEGAEAQRKDAEVPAEGGSAVAQEKETERGLLDPESGQELLEEQAEGGKVDKGFIDACLYVKDRMEEVSSPDKEMRQVLVVLYQEWFRVSSQKDSQADTVRLYLRQVGMTTPTLLPYVVNLTDGNGNMALHYSVSHSNFPVVKLLLDTGLCETDNFNKAGYTPVMLAALTAAESPDDLEVAQQLLKVGDVNARSRQAGQTALMLAVSHGRVAMVKLLLSCGADVNAQDREGSTALMCASEHGHTHIARLLLETGRCDTSLKDKNGQTALLVAEGASQQDIIDLLKANAEVQTSESTSTADLL
ncbi:KN motif and ankyrin repeat domain-containing protein 4 [Oreochromis niloticus]|uniref:KN motif and ankyrin repeat domains 4 n=1 Tax=Oreochromis niloticus TaxID=8128 RepID=A0A669D1H6_ORENI|nr:KN motif and ankyrin repeat domain-containing protein 4 [Oreochromis niloticus]XP_005457166.1 KN motif and ankyrin repeat domain-containing protein 4 [Oreochromis niloticus]XP_005457168.1 KN motif and ankyrin repeat domain-containing protein 4 [Oreochromis niloticus]XP_013131294.1 KN motif and ankyrin repeat domain-containing protein 4 [Oreochromis niloticus]XP_019202612.1 KN motif and ankyrin repeat domain-containing protein 4 [Oreochromis niloticus]XP_019202613.1 KN motif and ankyrin repe